MAFKGLLRLLFIVSYWTILLSLLQSRPLPLQVGIRIRSSLVIDEKLIR